MKVLQVLLAALVPLLERRVLAAERQAASAERLEDLLRTYLCWGESDFRDHLLGVVPEGEEASTVPTATADFGASRDLKLARMEGISALFRERFGAEPDDLQLVTMYEQMYEQDERGNADRPAPGAPN